MENLQELILNQETHLNELENLKRTLTVCNSEKAIEKSNDIKTTLEQIDREIETIYKEISVLRIRRLMDA